ncbi:MAG: hypothetical protein GX567_08835 [Clostridia bacterium]|nr:hypothetical protein [Clostridia bacterium]
MVKKFILCGTLGWCLEIIFTAFESFRRRELKLKGTTSIWMFPIYGSAVLLHPFCQLLKHKCIWKRGLFYAFSIFTAEYLSGSLLKKYKLCPWDYSRSKWSINGLIRLDYAPFWFLTGLLYEKIMLKS